MANLLRIGILFVNAVQLLDLATVDLLYRMTPTYLIKLSLARPFIGLIRPSEIHYIDKDGPNTFSKTTVLMTIRLTDLLTDSAVSPVKLDIVLIPGPSQSAMPPEEEHMGFLCRQDAAATTILGVCTHIGGRTCRIDTG